MPSDRNIYISITNTVKQEIFALSNFRRISRSVSIREKFKIHELFSYI